MTETLFLAIIPAVLVVLGGMFVLRKGSARTSGQRFLLYLLVIAHFRTDKEQNQKLDKLML